MIGKVLTVSAITAMLLFSGCENDAEDRITTQQMLDSGNYNGVISILEPKDVKTDDDKLKLASAYMDKAGFSLTDLISIVASGEDETDSPFASFVTSVKGVKTADTLDDLQNAIYYYGEIVDVEKYVNASPSRADDLNESEEDITIDTNEFFLGLAYMTKAATVLSYMGDVSKLQEVGDDANILASGCAMAKVYAPSKIPKECASVNYVGLVTIEGSNYSPIEVILNNGNGERYYLLANDNREHLILTDYTTNFVGTSYPLPVKDEHLTVLSALLDTLNGAFDFILSAAPDDVKKDIIHYRDEINSDSDPKISVIELTTYLNSEMAKQ